MLDTEIQTIIAAMQAGDPGEAERRCMAKLEENQDESDVLLLLGLSLQQQQRFTEALGVYARLAKLNPENSLHWGNYAVALRKAGNLDAAGEAFAVALRLKPDDVDLLTQHGALQLLQRQFLDARSTLLKAYALAPDSPEIRIRAAQACMTCRDSDFPAETLLRPWREWLPLENTLQYTLAELQLQLADANIARELLEDLLSREPDDMWSKLLLAGVYERINRVDDAEALLRQLEGDPAASGDEARGKLAFLRARFAMRRRNVTKARAILEESGPTGKFDFKHFFTLAEACDKAGDVTAAMQALRAAHEQQTAEIRLIAPHRFDPGIPAIPAATMRVDQAQYQKWPHLKTPNASQSPVFIVGFPRSGTTLLEQMLDAHPRLQSMDERPFFNILTNQLREFGVRIPEDIHKLNQRDCDELRKGYLTLACSKVPRRWDAQLVDKNPLNMLWLPIIHRLFPEAKFILALRHPCDVMLSCYMQNFQSLVLTVACASLESLAKAYVAAFDCWLHHVEVFKPDVFVSRYEELVADTPKQTRSIAEFLGLGDAESLLRFDERAREKGYIATPSYTQVIEPINKKGLNRWHRYRQYFGPVLPIVQPMLDRWGYTTV